MPFRLEHITLADRVELGCACLLVAGQYGAMTELAAALGCAGREVHPLVLPACGGPNPLALRHVARREGVRPTRCAGYKCHPASFAGIPDARTLRNGHGWRL